MYEVEIKVPADVADVRARLRDAGAAMVGARRQTDTYYDAPHRDFAETDEALRIRREVPLSDGEATETATLTYKGPLLDAASKTRAEHETAVDDGEALAAVLDGVGFAPAATVEKRREFWTYDGFTVTLDDVTGLDEYVEIEREVETEGEVDATREAAAAALDRLGVDADEQVRTSYLGLLLSESDG